MAYKTGIVKLITQGTIASTQDFSFGLCFDTGGLGAPSFSDLQTWLSAVGPATTAFATAINGMSSTAVTYSTLRAEYYAGGNTASLIANFGLGGPVTGVNAPTNSSRAALVASLITNRPGRSYRGRIYVPCLVPSLTASTRVPNTTQNGLRNALRTYCKAVEATPLTTSTGPQNPALVVASKLLGSAQPVTGIRTDDLLDTQRRRENDFQPVYTTLAY